MQRQQHYWPVTEIAKVMQGSLNGMAREKIAKRLISSKAIQNKSYVSGNH